ncbi:MAG: TerB family tellurite resistance protein [Burkholderiaceae bacterium]|nr:TerB family tellurite resistance protein [Burkholderiaceae bacterium]
MFETLIRRLSREPSPPPVAQAAFERRQLAVAALLVEAAHIDRHAGDAERRAVAALLREHFGLPEGDAQRLLEQAEERYAASLDDWIFARAVRDGFDEEERLEVLRMIWEVVYSDGRLAAFELDLLQRLCAALGLDDDAAEGARVLAFARANPFDPEQAGES